MLKRKPWLTIILITLILLCFISTAIAATYTYDNLGRLISVTYDNGQKINYEYDAGGNIRKVIVPDVTPPNISSTDPASGNVGVAINKNIIIQFSENVQPSSNFSGISLKAGTNIIGYTYSFSEKTLTIAPNNNLAYNTQYTVDIPANSVKDMANNNLAAVYSFNFTTSTSQDTVAPIVYSSDPANNTIDIPINKTISITFSEDIQEGINFSNISLKHEATVVEYTYNINGKVLTINPNVNLAYGTTYSVSLPADSIKDLANNGLVGDFNFTFTTQIGPDIAGPVVNSTNPVNGASDVPVNQIVTLTFNENIQAAVNLSGITLKTGETVVDHTLGINGNMLTITPVCSLSHNTDYLVTIPAGAVQDDAGNDLAGEYTFVFTTIFDTTAPIISSTEPVNGATDVPVSSVVTVTFNEGIQQGVNMSGVTLKAGETVIDYTYSISGTDLILDPINNLAYETVYSIYIPSGAVQDLAGNNLEVSYSFSFTTVKTPDTSSPIVTSTDPANNSLDTPVDKQITINFSENITPGNTFENILLQTGNTVVECIYNVNNNTLYITPKTILDYDAIYTVSIPAESVQDVSGNVLTENCIFNFMTGVAPDTTAPCIVTSSPINGALNAEVNTPITFSFNECIQQGINFGEITFTEDSTVLSYTYNISGNLLSLIPTAELNYNSDYSVFIPAGAVEDTSGNTLATSYSFTFKTYAAPDITNPIANINSLLENQRISGTNKIKVSASDNIDLAKVEIYVDDTLVYTEPRPGVFTWTETVFAYDWDTAQVDGLGNLVYGDGAHVVTVKAYDMAGNIGIINRNVTVDNNSPQVSKAIQPDEAAGKDVFIYQNHNYGNNSILYIGSTSISDAYIPYRSLIQFDLSAIPNNAAITKAEIKMYLLDGRTVPMDVSVHEITGNWTEGTGVAGSGASWTTYNGVDVWGIAGGDYNAIPESTVQGITNICGWYTWDITNLAQGWFNGTTPNNGVLFKWQEDASIPVAYFYSSDYTTDPSLRPQLVITYSIYDSTIPVASISSPLEGQRISGMNKIRVNGSDNIELAKVEIYVDDTLIHTEPRPDVIAWTETVFAYDWDTAQVDGLGNRIYCDGFHIVTVKVYDTAGNIGIVYRNVTVDNSSPQVIKVIQPDSVAGKDTLIRGESSSVNYNYGNNIQLNAGIGNSNPVWEDRTIIQFDLSSIPANAAITKAELKMYMYGVTNGLPTDLSVYQVNRSWTKNGVTWNKYDGVNSWTSPGGDYYSVPDSTVQGITSTVGWYTWDITSLTQDWFNETTVNNGILIKGLDGCFTDKYFYSSDYTTDPSLRPQLVVTYSVYDNLAPNLVAITPDDGATSVPIVASITLTYDEDILSGSNINGVALKAGETLISSAASINGTTLTISPSNILDYSVAYTVYVPAGAVKDVSGNETASSYSFGFSTESPPDTADPIIINTAPVDGATAVPVGTSITLTYDEDIQSGSNINGVTLKAGETVISSVTSISGSTLTITPSSVLDYSVAYTVYVPAGAVKDVSGNETVNAYSFGFSTENNSTSVTVIKTIQPDAAGGKDTYINGNTSYMNYNYGARTYMTIGYYSGQFSQARGQLQFDLSDIPAGVTITKAELKLYSPYTFTNTMDIEAHKITRSWIEGTGNGSQTNNGATWYRYDGVNLWANYGGDYDSTIVCTTQVGTNSGWYVWDITNLVQGWFNGTEANNGIILKGSNEYSTYRQFWSSDHSDQTWRPKLVVTYATVDDTVPQGNIISPIQGQIVSGTNRIKVTATDNIELSSVEVYIDNTLIHAEPRPQVDTWSETSFSCYWDTTELDALGNKVYLDGSHIITVKVYDTAGHMTVINRNVTVNNDSSKTTYIIQPDAAGGKDTYINGNTSYMNYNYGARTYMTIGYYSGQFSRARGQLQFDLSDIPAGATITKAELKLYSPYTFTNTMDIEAHKITRSWIEGTGNGSQTNNGATWYRYDGLNLWTNYGGDYDSTIETITQVGTSSGWYVWDITCLVQEWFNGTETNNGIILKGSNEYSTYRQFWSGDYSDQNLRPQLEITYAM